MAFRRITAALALGTTAGAAALIACSIYEPSLLLEADVDAAALPDSSPEAGPARCNLVHPPARIADAGSGGAQELFFAVRSLDLGVAADAGKPSKLGYDIDDLCTCPEAEACRARAANEQHCDDPGGRDNSAAEVVKTFALISGNLLDQNQLNEHLANGDYGLLIRVSNYNGQPDDAEVTASIFVANGTQRDDAGKRRVPAWDGNDGWLVDSKSVLLGAADAAVPLVPNYFDTKAYVAGGVLVASLEVPLRFGQSDDPNALAIDLTNTALTARISRDGAAFKLENGQLGGRWPIKRLLGSLGSLPDPFTGAPMCPGTSGYDGIRATVCRKADVTEDPRAGNAALCDALSIGAGFTAYSAKAVGVTTRPSKVSPCGDASVDCE